jgi:hypothetical protein
LLFHKEGQHPMGRHVGVLQPGLVLELPPSPSLWQNILRRELGKELVLLAWAIEDADSALGGNALANWLGLVPEERWLLYTQTAATTGHREQPSWS